MFKNRNWDSIKLKETLFCDIICVVYTISSYKINDVWDIDSQSSSKIKKINFLFLMFIFWLFDFDMLDKVVKDFSGLALLPISL